MQETLYGIYALEPTERNREYAEKQKMHLIKSNYILVCCKRKPKNAVQITTEELWRLSVEERAWVLSCSSEIAEAYAQSYLAEHKDETMQRISAFIADFQANLEMEREKARGIDGKQQ